MPDPLSLSVPVAAQQPAWPDDRALHDVEHRLMELPGLVTEEEVDALGERLGAVAAGSALVLQGGDCVERFEDTGEAVVRRKLDQLRELAGQMRAARGTPVVTIGRLAGQYAKPRSDDHELSPRGILVPSYRGDAVNAVVADPLLRIADPRRLLTAYDCADLVLGVVRRTWAETPPDTHVHVSHELLLLPYEQSLVRGTYAASAHFGWIGERTRQLGGAHVRFAAAVDNPIGVKLGPRTTPDEARALTLLLNPTGRPGRLTFIVRMGADHVRTVLPDVVRAVRQTGVPVIWLCDPMHGNSFRTAFGAKSRSIPVMCREVEEFTHVLLDLGEWPGGLHLELTPEPVTECVDTAPVDVGVHDLLDYRSACDPRLNPAQAVELVNAFLAAH